MTTMYGIGGVTVGPCQICNQKKRRFYLCSRLHNTCGDCKETRENALPHASEELDSVPGKKRVTFSPTLIRENFSEDPEFFCEACDAFVEAALVTVPITMLASEIAEDLELAEEVEESHSVDAGFDECVPKDELVGDECLRRTVDSMTVGLATTYSELLITRESLDEVMYRTEKLSLDVEMLRGGVEYVFFNFGSVLRCREVRIEERICGIPFVLMVRIRLIARVPYLGFFVGLETEEGRDYSPLKRTIVLRAHNAFGKVIEKHAFVTYEKGACVHPCFDLTKPPIDDSMYGYPNFLKKDRIDKPDTLKDGRLCLSLQVKALH